MDGVTQTLPGSRADQATIALPPGDTQRLSVELPKLIGPYRIERQLGEGGMGVVLHGVHSLLQRPAALKLMRPEIAADRGFVDRFMREARSAAAVHHQHLVAIYDAGETDGRTWLAFEFVPGGDLDAELARGGPMAPVRALELVAQCADGLQALGEAGLVHRDIKPHNIFLDATGRAKLGDFGLARQTADSDRMTMTGTGMGTPAYMSPEQANGDPSIDIRADIHALGGTLYTLLTKRTPFTGATPWAVVNAVVNEPVPDPRSVRPDLSAELSGIIARAMAKRREDRFQTPSELAAACRAAIARLSGIPPSGIVATLPSLLGQVGLIGPFSGAGAWWLAASSAALLLLPIGLRPLCALDPDWVGPGYAQPAQWGQWLGFSAIAAALLWQPLRIARGERPGRGALLATTLLTGVVGGVLLWCAWRAVLDATDASRSWQPVVAISTTIAGLGWLVWWARRSWSRDASVVADQMTHLAQCAIPLLVATLAGLLIASGDQVTTNDSWSNRLLARAGEDEAAWAMAIAAPLATAIIAPLLRTRVRW